MTTSPGVPVLRAGDRLSRAEFERRYAAMPDLKKAELIEGVVYVGSPVSYVRHGRPHHILSNWLAFYEVATPGLIAADNTTVRLDLDNEPQPDLLLRLPEQAGGSSRIADDGYLEGPPELVIEVAASSVSYDLHDKLHAYRRNGVAEYLVHRVEDGEIDWFALDGGTYVPQVPDAAGVLRSRVFPGLWLDVVALLRGDLQTLRDVVARGCATDEHAAFVGRLRRA
ncbi:MAG: Uma2 family endonuclease [Planctomycetes bacterium]|nr:Uma2 family endonuclease [Planctomycetota bacterium]